MSWFKNFEIKAFFQELYNKAMETDLFGRAAQVGFYFSFAFFPLLLFLVTLTALFLLLGNGLDLLLHHCREGLLGQINI